jgi:hypothetical protein
VYSYHLPLKDSTEPSGRLDQASPGIASTTSRGSTAGVTRKEWSSMGAINRIISLSYFLMEQEFLKLQDHQNRNLASFQAVGNGKCIAFARTAFELENDDAKD